MAWSQTPASSLPLVPAAGGSSHPGVARPEVGSRPAEPRSNAGLDTPALNAPTSSAQAAPAATPNDPQPSSPAWLAQHWQNHRRWVAAILLAHMPRWADLDDLLQDVALAVVRKGAEVRDPEAFRPWLRTVAINAARLAARKGALRETATSLEAFSGDPGNAGVAVIARIGSGSADTHDRVGAADLATLDEEGQRLVELARTLPDGYREPLLLKAVHGMSYREIGQVLGLPETTVETRIARGRRMLREAATGGQAT